MLRILPLADELILPQARQEIYFFNRIGRPLPVAVCRRPPQAAGRGVQERKGDSVVYEGAGATSEFCKHLVEFRVFISTFRNINPPKTLLFLV